MKRISLDRASERVKDFVRALAVQPNGSVLELRGKPILRVLPSHEPPVDNVKLKAAIRKRRDLSRRLNRDWQVADREVWEQVP